MSEQFNEYKIKVNKELLYEALLCEDDELGYSHIAEISKVILIVMHKYYKAYLYMQNDLKHATLAVVLERRSSFNASKDAYNFIFTMARNELGNNIYRWTKENKIEDMLSFNDQGESDPESLDMSGLPPSIIKYYHYLTGEVPFNFKRISRKDAVDLLVWLKIKEKKKVPAAPDYIVLKKSSINTLYKLIRDLIES